MYPKIEEFVKLIHFLAKLRYFTLNKRYANNI